MNPSADHPSLGLARYAETFAAFVRCSLEYDLIDAAIKEAVCQWPADYALLDVGAGTGKVIEALAKDFDRPPSAYFAYEPNPAHFNALKDATTRLRLPRVVLSEDFFDEHTPLVDPVDLVLFSHSLYWMKDPASVVIHALERLRPGGLLLAILQGPYGVHTLLKLFEPELGRSTPMLQNNAFSSHELVQALRARGLEPNVTMLPTPLDVTELFQPGGAKRRSEVLSFCLQIEFDSLAPQLKKDVINFIEGASLLLDGRRLWYIPNALVTLTPQGLSD